MNPVNVTDLRHNFAPVERGLRRGKGFEINQNGGVVAILNPSDNRKVAPRGRPLIPGTDTDRGE